jgi:hypothetical protein
MLEAVCGEEIIFQPSAFERHRTFMDGHGLLEHSWSKDTVGQVKQDMHSDYNQKIK